MGHIVIHSLKNKVWRYIFALWIFFWILFLIRGFVKGEFRKFRTLSFLTVEQKKAYILGEDLYNFIKRCETEIPKTATYRIAGDLDEHNTLRMVYYLYPRIRSDNPDYTLSIQTATSRYTLKKER